MTLDLADVMQRATDGMPVETARLVNGAYARAEELRSSRRRRAAGLVVGGAAAVAVAGLVVPAMRLQHEAGQDREPYSSSPPPSTLRLLPDDVLAARFADLLPGTLTGLTVHHPSESSDVMFDGQLTTASGQTGYVAGDFNVGAALPADSVTENKQSCIATQRKVSDRDGTSCLLVQGGMIQTWDDTVPLEDPGDSPPTVRMAWINMTTWDGASATLRALNTTADTVAPEPGAVTVVRTQELVDLVQRMEWFEQP